ncbi:MAG TPA: PilC/PilY family type IV pilus protein [Woeseiaceae bacterium]|nr:PilC/PilY family type IV pilus protein [Woeseiaceae bacterium]
MFKSKKHFAWALAGAFFAMTTGLPAVADDVELLLSTPEASIAAKPNVLFILDSSGSMTTVETSQEPYNANHSYSGPCNLNRYYWTTNKGIPSCGSNYQFDKTAFVCNQGKTQISAAGSYTDTMAMYRKSSNKWKWNTLHKNHTSDAVECKSDSGIHGAGSNPADEPYARSGSNKPAYTDQEKFAVDWATQPIYRVYDSNYLNWYYNPPGTSMRRTDIVKAVTKNVLGSIKDVNVGFMRFDGNDGGPVMHAIKDLDSHRTQANAIVDALPASGNTPLAETLYEAALYYSGLPAYYGDLDKTDPEALASFVPRIYQQPVEYACSKNFVVLLTDGEPTADRGTWSKAPNLPDFSSALGRTTCKGDSDDDGTCLPDIAEYMSKADINPGLAGRQSVTTYTIGFTTKQALLKDTAESSGGQYYEADDVTSLTAALTDIVTNIFDRDISFTAPAVAVNAFNRTQHLNDLYVSVFRAADEVHWPGNMKKFTIKESEIRDANNLNAVDPDTGYFSNSSKNFWSTLAAPDGADVTKGGAANALPNPAVRKMYTDNTPGSLTQGSNALSTANMGSFTPADFGLTGAEGEPSMEKLINWTRGVDEQDEDNNPLTTVRYAMGDTLHSEPAAVVYGNNYGGQDIVVFNATNDGFLHAIDASTGEEIWSFIPHQLLENLTDLYFNENVDYKTYGLDGNIVPIVYDADHNGVINPATDFVYLVFGMRRGGDKYFMVDVTDRFAPSLKWQRTFPEFGQSWSTPSVAKIRIDSSAQSSPQDAVLVIGGGYDTSHDSPGHPTGPDLDGAGIYMLDLETGDAIWRVGRDSYADLVAPGMTRSIPSMVRVIDLSGDGYADRMYAADLGGQIWRFDISNGKRPNQLVAGGVIAQLGAEGLSNPSAAETRRFYTTPDVAMFTDKRQDRRYLAISIGSGYRAHPLDNSASDRFYSIRDPYVFSPLTQTQYNNYTVIKDSDLIDVAGKAQTTIPANGDGWKMSLSSTEKILSTSRTFDDSVYFVSFEPEVNSEDPCQAGLSLNRLYKLNVANGDPVVAIGAAVPSDGAEADAARVTRLEQGGIAPQPVFLFPSPWQPDCQGEECAPPPIVCVGVECKDPGFSNAPVRTLWTQDGID